MKVNKLTGAAIICALVLILAGWTMKSPTPEVWEYKFIQTKLDFKKTDLTMNELGAQGWEAYALNEDNGIVNIYFKRQK
jgi:hypothetical protein